MKLKRTILVTEMELDRTADNHYHIPFPHGDEGEYTGGEPLTLCGWVDVYTEDASANEHPADCPKCLEIVRYCKNLRL